MQHPKLPGQLEDSITELFYELSDALRSIEGMVKTMNRLGVLTNDEMRVIYTSKHATLVEQLRNK